MDFKIVEKAEKNKEIYLSPAVDILDTVTLTKLL